MTTMEEAQEEWMTNIAEALEEWRAARQDIFDNATKISEENSARWTRLSNAEHALMRIADDHR